MRFEFAEMPSQYFPMTFQFVDHETNEILHVITLTEPGAVRIPSNEEFGGRKVGVRTYYGTGAVLYKGPGTALVKEQ